MNYLLTVVLILVSACVSTPEPIAQHDLGVSKSSSIAIMPKSITVKAPQWLSDTAIHYRLLYSSPTRVRAYTLDSWLEPPPKLFQQKLQSSDKNFKYPLKIQLLDFEQQFISPDRAKVLVVFSVEALSLDETRVLGSQKFMLQQATVTADAKGAITAFAQLTEQAADRIYKWINTL
jgi:ABC-type uncharacterized transport system auxiliary subunit